MTISLPYDVTVCCDDYPCNDDRFGYDYLVNIGCQDIVEFLFKERYGKEWNPLSWHLEDGARELVKDIEDAWLRDDIDIYSMLQNLPLRDYLKDKYRDKVMDICINNHLKYLNDLHGYDKTLDYYDIDCEVR